MKNFKEKNSYGFDNVPLRVMRVGALILAKPLHKLLNLIYEQKQIPEQWKTSRIIPLHKKGRKTEIVNYRPISNLCAASKIFERAVLTRITSLAGPQGPYDAVNRSYVDTVASGLHVHSPALVATTANLATITSGTVIYDNGTNGVGATLTLSSAITSIDGQTYPSYYFRTNSRILVRNEDIAAYNGIYTISADGTVLTRATDFNTPTLVHGGDFVFVQYGDIYAATGWVQSNDTDHIGSSDIVFSQFAGPGTYKAGVGLYLDGTIFNANVNSSTGGIEIVSNQFQLKATLAGNGLTYTDGVLNVVGASDRITVSDDFIDIASTYVGQSSITTLGNVTTGTWNANTIATSAGGTGITSYNSYDLLVGKSDSTLQILAKGTAGQLLQVSSDGTALVYDILDGGTY